MWLELFGPRQLQSLLKLHLLLSLEIIDIFEQACLIMRLSVIKFLIPVTFTYSYCHWPCGFLLRAVIPLLGVSLQWFPGQAAHRRELIWAGRAVQHHILQLLGSKYLYILLLKIRCKFSKLDAIILWISLYKFICLPFSYGFPFLWILLIRVQHSVALIDILTHQILPVIV